MPAVEYGLSTSMIQGDMDRLRLFARYPATHAEIGFLKPSQLDIVLRLVDELGLTRGFHDPLPADPHWRWPSMTDPDPVEQARSLGVMSRTLATLDLLGAQYALTHFPSVHFETVEGWNREKSLNAAHEAASTLSRWAEERAMRILLENVGPNPYWDADAWVEIFETYPPLAFCLDIGHLHLDTGGDNAANLAFVEKLAPYTRQVHVYNATEASYREFHHAPVHPSHDPAQGWIDVPALLNTVLAGRRGALRIVFEHTPQFPFSETEVEDGMLWVRELVDRGPVSV